MPAHVRNDAHPLYEGYESWVEKVRELTRTVPSLNDVPKIPTIEFSATGQSQAPSPIARLIDANVYSGSNAQVLERIGLGASEYTNGNFFSGDTICKGFPLPRCPRPPLTAIEEGVGTSSKRNYYSKQGEGETIHHFVAEGTFREKVINRTLLEAAPGYVLDDRVYEEYATHLIPRAVGYSAALLDYFFRAGEFDFFIELDEKDPTQLLLRFQNLSPNEMVGTFTLYADTEDGTRHSVVSRGPDKLMTVGQNEPIPFPIDALPPGVQQLVMVFHGTHGPEPNAVGGGVKAWEMPFILAKQELAEFTSTTTEDRESDPLYPGNPWKSRYKDPEKQLVKGTFVTPGDSPAGKYVKRVWLDYGDYPGFSTVLRLFDSEGSLIPWNPVSYNENTLTDQAPARWEIEVNAQSIWNSTRQYNEATQHWDTISWVTLPRWVVIETVAGTILKNPLVWWKSSSVGSSAGTTELSQNCTGGFWGPYYCLGGSLTSTDVHGELFFGDGDLQGNDRDPLTGQPYPVEGTEHTTVHFTPDGSVMGHAVGTTDNKSGTWPPTKYCAVSEGEYSAESAHTFQAQSLDGAVWVKDTFHYSEMHGRFKIIEGQSCVVPEPTPPDLPPFPDAVTLKREYLPAEIAFLQKLGLPPGPDYTITLK